MCVAAAIAGSAIVGGYVSSRNADKAADASRDAAKMQADYGQKVLDLYKPYVDAGANQLPELENSATLGGYGNTLSQILGIAKTPGPSGVGSSIGSILSPNRQTSGGNFLQPLIDARQQAATSYFAARGLRRSGAAGKAAADIPTDLALQIESELNRRRQAIAGAGQTGVQGSAGTLTGIGEALAAGRLGVAQAQAQGAQGIANSVGSGISAYANLSQGGSAYPWASAASAGGGLRI
jgi:hypothetical protein